MLVYRRARKTVGKETKTEQTVLANMVGSRRTPPFPSLHGDVRPFRRPSVKCRVVLGSKGYSGIHVKIIHVLKLT